VILLFVAMLAGQDLSKDEALTTEDLVGMMYELLPAKLCHLQII